MHSKQINIHEAKTHLSKLLVEVGNGVEIIIAKTGEPLAKLIPIGKKHSKRAPGSAKGKVILSDNFDDPLPSDTLNSFYE
jgi:prevent-host-death family protein